MVTPAFAILRTQKLKNLISVSRSLKHSFREQNTPNANPELSSKNTHLCANSSTEALANIKNLLPEKRRKDAVLCIEYLVTASPHGLNNKTREAQDKYFEEALTWLKERHGEKNIAYAGIHRDETTPHLYAYVVPLEASTGRLNAKRWLGGTNALRIMQSEFAEQVGQNHGFERGIERKRAHHQTVQQFYSALDNKNITLPQFSSDEVAPQVLSKGFFSDTIEGNSMLAERLTQMMNNYYAPIVKLVSVMQQEQKTNQNLKRIVLAQRKRLEVFEKNFQGLRPQQVEQVISLAQQLQWKNKAEEQIKSSIKTKRVKKIK